ncbi:hypothetical protein [Seonamhaeicola aphaedonensis]|uniref:Uncharacterized protein n=1 Tax=Seonamhaeicola aphaedonensis TaxID=1461338 RepID=A0A3D9HIY8_9FLAO|nr:hypothetical protein [Seonamhaeicola aphaedonensis]RED49450.1 hypothetical protein DFQ02_102222 [Seonamhaeicola aphaedonensis]
MTINHITTPLDSATLDSKEHYIFYHKMVDYVFKELIVAVQQNSIINNLELNMFKQYCDLLLYSIEAMRVKYMYDEEDNMKVDLTESGFPNYLEFRYLFNDLELRDDYLGKLTPISELQEEFLDTLLRKKEPIKKTKLFQAASIVYYSSVNKQYIFNRFVQGKIVSAPKDSQSDFLTSWSFYDVASNRPFVCFMYFNYYGNKIDDYKESIYEVLKHVADRKMNLDTMAYGIDRKLAKVSPKLIKRIDLGPLHNMFAKDANEFTHLILEGISKKEIPVESYALSMKIDQVTSKSEFKEGSFFSKQILQRWDEIFKQKYVFAPHRIIQLLYNKSPELMNKLAKPPIEMAELKIEKIKS